MASGEPVTMAATLGWHLGGRLAEAMLFEDQWRWAGSIWKLVKCCGALDTSDQVDTSNLDERERSLERGRGEIRIF